MVTRDAFRYSFWKVLFGSHVLTVKQLLLCACAVVDARNDAGRTPLAGAIKYNRHECAEILLDVGAKISKVSKDITIPDWMTTIINKRNNFKTSALVFLGVLRERLLVPSSAGGAPGDRFPRDMVNTLSSYIWEARFDPQWIVGVAPKKANECK